MTEPEFETDGTPEARRGLAAWLWPGEWREAVARWVIAALAAAVAVTALVLHPWLNAVLLPGAFLVGAALRRNREQLPAEDEEEEEELPVPDPADVADIVRELGTGTGVLLTGLRDQLLEEYPGQGWTTKRLRPLLAEAGVRVREGVRVTGVGNGPGVHRDDVPPPLPSPAPSPPVGVVAAGQDANANTNNAKVVRHADGALITVTPAGATVQKA